MIRLINLTDLQKRFLLDEEHRFFVIPSGRRARKTLISSRKIIFGDRGAVQSDKKRFFQGAPTRQQAKDIFWEKLKTETKEFQRKRPNESELYVELHSGSRVYVIGLDRPERIEGMPWDGCHITEVGNLKHDAWPAHIRPVLSDTGGFAILDGVPEGWNDYYDLALYSCGGFLPTTEPIIGAFAENKDDPEWCYYHWFSSDVLNPSEIHSARMHMDEKTFRQEFEGSFENYAGLAYYAFSELNLDIELQRNPDEHIHIGMDFNVNPMTATLNHIRGDDVLQWGEIYLNNSRTFEMRDYILDRYPVDLCTIYPDSTGKHESSNAQRSDIAILRSAGFKVLARSAPPRVINRVNAVNSKMKAGDGKPHYFVNPKNCPKTVNDWNHVMRTDDGRLDKSQEGKGIKHTSDGEGYLIDFNFPIQRSIATGRQL